MTTKRLYMTAETTQSLGRTKNESKTGAGLLAVVAASLAIGGCSGNDDTPDSVVNVVTFDARVPIGLEGEPGHSIIIRAFSNPHWRALSEDPWTFKDGQQAEASCIAGGDEIIVEPGATDGLQTSDKYARLANIGSTPVYASLVYLEDGEDLASKIPPCPAL
jgi:hypothetical protein